MSNTAYKDLDAAVRLPSLNVSEDASDRLYSRIINRLPFGFDEGAAKLILSYKGTELLKRHQAGRSVDDTLDAIAHLSQMIDGFEHRTQSFSGTLKRCYAKAASFVSENIVIFGSAAFGAVVGPVGGVIGSTAATYPQVFGGAFLEEFKHNDCDLKDVAQIHALLDDDVFVKQARKLSHVRALKMSSAVLAAGALAGYVYSSVARPAAQVGANVGRSLLSGFSAVAKESGAQTLGEGVAYVIKSFTNAATKKSIELIPARALLVSGMAYHPHLDEHIAEERHDLGHDHTHRVAVHDDYGCADHGDEDDVDTLDAFHASVQNLPEHNRSALYL